MGRNLRFRLKQTSEKCDLLNSFDFFSMIFTMSRMMISNVLCGLLIYCRLGEVPTRLRRMLVLFFFFY